VTQEPGGVEPPGFFTIHDEYVDTSTCKAAMATRIAGTPEPQVFRIQTVIQLQKVEAIATQSHRVAMPIAATRTSRSIDTKGRMTIFAIRVMSTKGTVKHLG